MSKIDLSRLTDFRVTTTNNDGTMETRATLRDQFAMAASDWMLSGNSDELGTKNR